MEISLENVQEKFILYSGEPMDGQDPRRDKLCGELCRECAGWVGRRLLPGAEEGRAGEAESWAAARAFYQLTLLDQAAGPMAVASPELKVELGDRARHAWELCEEKYRACAGLLGWDRFYFGQV